MKTGLYIKGKFDFDRCGKFKPISLESTIYILHQTLKIDYCQAQSQLQLSWAELALFSLWRTYAAQPTAYAAQSKAYAAQLTAYAAQPTAYAAQPTVSAAQPTAYAAQLTAHAAKP